MIRHHGFVGRAILAAGLLLGTQGMSARLQRGTASEAPAVLPAPSPVYGQVEDCAAARPSPLRRSGQAIVWKEAIPPDAVSLREDKLFVRFGHACGCGEHDFRLCFASGADTPAVLDVKLFAWTTNVCEKGCSGDLVFDLGSVRRVYAARGQRRLLLRFESGQRLDFVY